jgi:hypothetical protein
MEVKDVRLLHSRKGYTTFIRKGARQMFRRFSWRVEGQMKPDGFCFLPAMIAHDTQFEI